MRLDRFCKVVGVLMLLFITAPIFWMLFSMFVLGLAVAGFESQLGSTPTTPGIEAISAVLLYFMLAAAVISVLVPMNLFFERNWLAWLIKWLSPDGKVLRLTEIVIRMDPPKPPPPPSSANPPPATDQPPPTAPYRHPDEPYLPPQYRSKK